MNDGSKSTGAIALVSGGIASAFALAACCAIPFLLAAVGLGISASWFAPIVAITQPYAGIITAFSAVALLASIVIVLRAPKHCEPGSLCARPLFRWSIVAAAAIGLVLLILSKIYA